MQLAGNPTLATAYILYEIGLVLENEAINFIANSDKLKITEEGPQITMDFHKYDLRKIDLNPSLKNILGFEPIALYESDYDWKIAVASSSKELIKSKPNFKT